MSSPLLQRQYFHPSNNVTVCYAEMARLENQRGLVVVIGGRTEPIEKKHLECDEPLQEMGFGRLYYEGQNQGASSSGFHDPKGYRDHIRSFNTYVSDFRHFYLHVVKEKAGQSPIIFMPTSLYGHITLRAVTEHEDVKANALILSAPMLALFNKEKQKQVKVLTEIFCTGGLIPAPYDYGSTRFAFGQKPYGKGKDDVFETNVNTLNPKFFHAAKEFYRKYPRGGVTWGWGRAAIESLKIMYQTEYFKSMTIPTLGLIGAKDIKTPTAEVREQLERIPGAQGRIITIPDALHEILSERNAIRRKAWVHIRNFLNEVVPT